MAISLQSFGMRRSWHNINHTNNIGYLAVTTGSTEVLHEFQITPGSYSTFAALAIAMQDSITAMLPTGVSSVTVAYLTTPRTFRFTFSVVSGVTVQIKTFAIKSGALPTGVSLKGGFSDLHEILGSKPIRAVSETHAALKTVGGNLESRYPAALNTMDSIYLHLPGLETGNFMCTGHESHLVDSIRLVESSMFARIPFEQSFWNTAHEMIQFEDNGGDAFQSFLSRKSLENLEMRVTDAKGRPIGDLGDADNPFTFHVVLRFDIFTPKQGPPAEPSHGILHKPQHPPSVNHR